MKRPPAPAATRLGLGLLAALGGAALSGCLTGWRSPVTAIALHAGLMRWSVDALPATQPELRAAWFRVRPGEAALYRRAGTYAYMRLLRRLGWERLRRESVGFTGRAALGRLERAGREAETNHLLIGSLGLLVAALAARRRAWKVTLWHLLLTVVLHAYPIMLQRTLRARLTRPPSG
ncbi:hypothetical protein [Deinococcus aquaticus]|uniref:glycosyl-4,4'-diaponeurosporenoate acyltransferase CrtO family protein n=1 Tax=Deinococcus aquaticus TaxID=328692 RepID=UPI003F460D7A